MLSIYDILRINREEQDKQIALRELVLPKIPTIYRESNILETLVYIQKDIEQIAVVNEAVPFMVS